jgi:hypothetical protein
VKKQLTPKRTAAPKKEYLTEMLTVTTGMSVAILFPYVELKKLFLVLPTLNRSIRGLFLTFLGANKSISIKQYLTSRFSPHVSSYSEDQKRMLAAIDDQNNWFEVLQIVSYLRKVKVKFEVGRAPQMLDNPINMANFQGDYTYGIEYD